MLLPRFYIKEKNSIQIRLKGDWTDHLEGHKWSTELKQPKAMHLKEWSFQFKALILDPFE